VGETKLFYLPTGEPESLESQEGASNVVDDKFKKNERWQGKRIFLSRKWRGVKNLQSLSQDQRRLGKTTPARIHCNLQGRLQKYHARRRELKY